MRSRRILPGETGVRYTDGDTEVIWSFAPLHLDLDGDRQVTDVVAGTSIVAATVDVTARRIVLLRPTP